MSKKHFIEPGIIEELFAKNPIPVKQRWLTASEIREHIRKAVAYWEKVYDEKKRPEKDDTSSDK
jgi:hypothetical protein